MNIQTTEAAPRSYKRTLQVTYPTGHGDLVLRTELDWDRDVDPIGMSSDGTTAPFEVEAQRPFVHFKPCLKKASELHWARGTNNLLTMAEPRNRVPYPYFFAAPWGRFSSLVSQILIDLLNEPRMNLEFQSGEKTFPARRFAISISSVIAGRTMIGRGCILSRFCAANVCSSPG